MTTQHADEPIEASSPAISRRTAVAGIGAVALGGAALAACAPSKEEDGGASGAIKTGDIPVGGGKIYKDQNIVVTQPKSGEFKAFDATCTHQACPVSQIVKGEIICTCHGSKFSATDGFVTQGPATQPLTEQTITVKGDEIVLG